MERVIVTRPIIGICHMQVCACNDASEAEILEVANRDNPAGTSQGWTSIERDGVQAPVPCKDEPDRTHYLLAC